MKKIILVVWATMISWAGFSQTWTYNNFMQAVLHGNKAYEAEQLNVKVAKADANAARIFQDPEIAVGYDNNSDWDIMMGQAWNIELSKSFSMGKVSARSKVADHQCNSSQAMLDDYLHNLRIDATIAYLDALLARDLTEIGYQAYENMRALYKSDSLRLAKGDISALDAMQTHLEMTMSKQTYQTLNTEYQNTLLTLDEYSGDPTRATQDLTGKLKAISKVINVEDLILNAVEHRQDVHAAQMESITLESMVELTRMERVPDVAITASVSSNSRVRNEEAPAPQFIGYSIGLSMPLPFSTLNRGEVRSAQLQSQQAQLHVEALQDRVRKEVLQAYRIYESARMQVLDFSQVLLDQSQQVLDGKTYAYHRGEVSLLDLLSAQHSHFEVREAYATALHRCMTAYVELMRACGYWEELEL
ncbi:MAG: TolC family protein [Bacteroidales bacterium]|nr:TolC family protein [Bacteroidales bacterium]